MRLTVLSDLHFEFHQDGGLEFVRQLDPTNVDVLVLAGDIGTCGSLGPALTLLAKKYPHVLYVNGNHEFYGKSREDLRAVVAPIADQNPNLRWLQNDVVTIDGQRFLGTTLWFPKTKMALMIESWGDYRAIPNLSDWVFEENARAQTFLKRELQPNDVVITHHLPSFMSVHPNYAGSATNCFYVCDVEELMLERGPRLWFHGHTHESARYVVGNTEVVCNPFGYAGYQLNPKFNDRLIIEI